MISADEAAFAAVRVMGTCFATGHAAGVRAACLAVDEERRSSMSGNIEGAECFGINIQKLQ